MIIKLIAETEAERKRFGGAEQVEHLNVKEYFFSGNKVDPEGSIVDFHEWNGGFRYLLGTLKYFYEVINDDRRKAAKNEESENPFVVSKKNLFPMVKRGFGGPVQNLDLSRLNVQTGETMDDEFVEQADTVELTDDEFAEEQTLKFNPKIADQDVKVAVDDIKSQIKKEADAKLKGGLKIT